MGKEAQLRAKLQKLLDQKEYLIWRDGQIFPGPNNIDADIDAVLKELQS